MKVLVVDDFAAMRETVEEYLKGLGVEVIVCGSGEKAVPYLDKVGVLITDLEMPGGMGGDELARVAKGKNPDMPVLIMTGRVGLVPKDHLADAVFEKPFQLHALGSWLGLT
ncbi:MAG: response regulator [Candidatus Paceibacterota bacterium]|jgi:hypothetical protein